MNLEQWVWFLLVLATIAAGGALIYFFGSPT